MDPSVPTDIEVGTLSSGEVMAKRKKGVFWLGAHLDSLPSHFLPVRPLLAGERATAVLPAKQGKYVQFPERSIRRARFISTAEAGLAAC